MRILEIELINHVVIPKNFKISLRGRTDVICIDGLNGSGKSFLINNIHPLSSNKRFNYKYPILKGKRGLKRIIYELGNERELEILHEYVVKGERHSCKSYCNLYENGCKTELNPTGHNSEFETIIAKYLFFDNNSFICSFLSPKAESIVNVTASKRREILKNTMKVSKVLDKVVDKNRSLLSEFNSTIKVYDKQVEETYRSLPYKTLGEFDRAIKEKTEEIELVEKTEDEYRGNLTVEYEQSSKYNSYPLEDIPIISSYIEILKSLDMNDMRSAFELFDSVNKSLSILEYRLVRSKKTLSELKDKRENTRDTSSLLRSLKEMESEYSQKTKTVHSEIDPKGKYALSALFESISNSIDDLSNYEITFTFDPRHISKEIELKEKEINHANKFIQDYNEKLRLIEDDSINTDELKIEDNCMSCPYFNKFVKSRKFVEEHKKEFDKEVYNLEEYNRDLDKLLLYKRVYIKICDTVTKILVYTNSEYIKDDTIWLNADEITKKSLTSPHMSDELREYWKTMLSNIQRTDILRSEIGDLKLKIANSINGDIAEIDRLITKEEENQRDIQKDIKIKLGTLELFKSSGITRGTRYDSMCKQDLEKEYVLYSNMGNKKKEIKNRIEAIEGMLKNIDKKKSILKEECIDFRRQRKGLKEMSEYLVELKASSTKHSTLKDILETKIPLYLLRSNIDFIENNVNTIMEENEINLSVDIMIEDDEVRIQVSTRNQDVDDITQCSSGELCLLGVVLNAVLMHIIGYNIISFDEMDSNLDVVYRERFHNVIYSILEKLDIEQIFCVSHNISFDMNVSHIVIGEYEVDRLHGEIIEY